MRTYWTQYFTSAAHGRADVAGARSPRRHAGHTKTEFPRRFLIEPPEEKRGKIKVGFAARFPRLTIWSMSRPSRWLKASFAML
jgi:hypothetical protein